ncbi:MAG: Hpt domain-containing protein [Lachnospiraceae bacterium]|nr:Hpt domain-containing protein [Lachnospiraceae bacterium]
MTIQECYRRLGGNYEEVEGRLMNLRLIQRFIGKFLQDDSFATLCNSMEEKNLEVAFRASHTLKGVCQNLGFTTLFHSSEALTDLLRHEKEKIPEQAYTLLEDVKRDYADTVAVIQEYLSENTAV